MKKQYNNFAILLVVTVAMLLLALWSDAIVGNMENKEKIIKLLKSGDFTIIYWDSGEATLYQKKWDKDEEFIRDDYETMDKFKIEIPTMGDGYLPTIVELLAEALGGRTDSI